MAIILLNIASMAVVSYGQSQEITHVLEVLNLVFSSIFIVEMILKL